MQNEAGHPHDLEFASVWRSTPKIVFSRTLRGPLDWNARVINDDVASAVAELKAAPGKDLLLNGGSTIGALLASLGLLDEIQVIVHPVILGGGKPLLPIDRLGLDLVSTRTFDNRSVLLSYVPA